ncbi:amino acid ABC transporter permease [Ottowia sp.]|jgi:polar amino acid transport system permease protein|uniref:amino acid ABC transporter permease n=1 Tax=Ottowia sp. TaxID=1898956 RepID=UPI0025E91629|nr:amino acid ABC transporter permease [Ottowia sp.]MBK6612888.1 amino acid ABC transporter permease [Ottowia sp.]MBK6747978.1 amino acid ABC transporter permease [Ottowia sp.]
MDALASIDWGVMFRPEYRVMLLQGIRNTLALTAGAIVGGLLLGMVVAFGRLASSRWIRLPATAYVELVRTIPLLVHVMFWYFAVPEMLPDDVKRVLYRHDVGFYTSLVALILYAAAFISEDIRSGIRGIAPGQAEAAHSLGFGFFDTFRLVILPQALRTTVPPLLGQAMNITKNTTVALMVGVGELAFVTRAVNDASFLSVGVYAFTTVFFLLIAIVLTALGQWYQRRYPAR